MTYRRLLALSRPHFRLYTFGPFLIGRIAGFADMFDGLEGIRIGIGEVYSDPWIGIYTFVASVYFLIIANILIYGVNDYADREIDHYNDKKGSYEIHIDYKEKKTLVMQLWLWCGPMTLLLLIITGYTGVMSWLGVLVCILGFLFFAGGYSLPPIRAKTKPILDSLFNVLYQFGAPFGRVVAGHSLLSYNPWIWIGGRCGMMAWHTFSALPDMEADAAASIQTTAIWLGYRGTLVYCFLLWGIAFACFSVVLSSWALPGLIVFWGFCIMTWYTKNPMLVYRYIPWCIAVLGTLYFWVIIYYL